MGVSIAPGATALIRMPEPAYSIAAVLVIPTTPCLVAVYTDCFGSGRKEFVEAMLTIAPPPRSSMARISYFRQRKIDLRLTATSRSKVASSQSASSVVSVSIAAALQAQSRPP